MKRQRIYAWVTSETCTSLRAFAPGDVYQGGLVATHGDLCPWYHNKRETLDLAISCPGGWGMRAAVAVARVLGWD